MCMCMCMYMYSYKPELKPGFNEPRLRSCCITWDVGDGDPKPPAPMGSEENHGR